MLRSLLLSATIAGLLAARVDTRVKENAYFRFTQSSEGPTSFSLMAAEVEVEGRLSKPGRDIMSLVLQVYVWGTMEGWAKAMHYGNAYAVFPLGLGRPSIKVGQQVVPFGLLSYYDTHGQVFENPYALVLGARIDAGVSVFGLLGPLDWWYMISNGSGPNLVDRDDNKVQTGRIALKAADYTVGFSVLRGILPRFHHNPLVDMMAEPDSFLMKNRAGLDFELSLPLMLFRGELAGGRYGAVRDLAEFTQDGQSGAYAEARIPIRYGLEIMGMYSSYRAVLEEPSTTQDFGAGMSYTPAGIGLVTVQLAGIRRQAHGETSDHLVVQLGATL